MEETNIKTESQENVGQQTPQQTAAEAGPPSSGKKSKKKWIIIAVVIILILAIGGYLILQTPDLGDSEEPSPTPELEVIPTPAPALTPEPVLIDKEEVTITIFNGTGIAGEAGLLQTRLEDLGYVLIEVDNADSTDNEVTLVVFAKNIPQVMQDEIVTDLEEAYTSISSSTSSSLNDNEIEITTGLRTSQTPKPTTGPVDPIEDDDPVATPTDSPTETDTPTP